MINKLKYYYYIIFRKEKGFPLLFSLSFVIDENFQ